MNIRLFVAAIAAAGVAGSVAAPTAAWAQPAASALDQCKVMFDEGQIAFVSKDFAKAAKHFQDAYALRTDIVQILFNVGASYEELGKEQVGAGQGAEAIASFQAAITNYYANLGPEALGATGTGSVSASFDDSTNELTFFATFSGLSGLTTQSHFHCCTSTPFAGTAGIAVDSPTLTRYFPDTVRRPPAATNQRPRPTPGVVELLAALPMWV